MLTTTEGPIESNDVPLCLFCGWPIYPDNDSGWEAFTEDGHTTQPVCIRCDRERMQGGGKLVVDDGEPGA